MMLVERIVVENFGPYADRHEIAFKGDSHELVLVHGENMAGKTSLLNAIRWGLYGVAKDRAGKPMETRQLINREAFANGAQRLSVTLHLLSRDGDTDTPIELRRQRQGKKNIDSPSLERDFEEFLDVSVNGDIRSPDKYDDVVNELLPERISRFFLFDGELLKEYEELVHEDSSAHAKEVKRAIEMILGVPAAISGKRDLAVLRAEASRRYNREAKKDDRLSDSASAAERLEDEIEAQTAELELLTARLHESQQEILACNEELEKHSALRDDAIRRSELERRRTELKEQDGERRKRRRDLVRDLWRDVIESRLAHEIEQLEEERDAIGKAIQERDRLRRDLTAQTEAMDDDRCSACGQPIPEEKRLAARQAVTAIRKRLEEIERSADTERHDELGAIIRRLRDIAPAGVASGIAEIERDLDESAIALHKIDREIEVLSDKLSGYDSGVVEQQERERTRLNKLVGKTEETIEKVEAEIAEKVSELRGHQRAIRERDVPTLKRLQATLDLYEQAEHVFELSIDDLIAELRADVEQEASTIFLQLTTDPSYRGLRINDNYGLTILDAAGEPVPVRSAGAEQIVALSLIGALNRLAAKRGPVIMDTPFGRLDRSHRENIMRFVPTLADQVVLLVHSGELDPDQDLEPVKGMVSAEYRIDHVTSAESTIERV